MVRTEPGGRRRPPQGAVLWQGPSRIDGRPVAAVATGLLRPSTNVVTGLSLIHI